MVEEAVFWRSFVKQYYCLSVWLVAVQKFQDRAFANDKIHFAWNMVEEIKGEQK